MLLTLIRFKGSFSDSKYLLTYLLTFFLNIFKDTATTKYNEAVPLADEALAAAENFVPADKIVAAARAATAATKETEAATAATAATNAQSAAATAKTNADTAVSIILNIKF
jgi:hypothetical protein